MIFLAVSTLDKIKDIPLNVWLKLGGAVLGLIVAIVILRKVVQVNKLVLTFVLLFAFSVIGFNWIYERNEPAFLTPIVEKLAPFFPTKDSYGAKQKTTPKNAR